MSNNSVLKVLHSSALENPSTTTHHVVKREPDVTESGPTRGKAQEQPVKGLETFLIQYLAEDTYLQAYIYSYT